MHTDENKLTLEELKERLKDAEEWIHRPEINGFGEKVWLQNKIVLYKRLITKIKDAKKAEKNKSGESGGDSKGK
jgi:hypothetical protein